MDTEKLSVEVHNEFARRMEEHNALQDRRIDALEENVKQIQTLTIAVEKMAVSTETMAKELGKQGDSISKLDNRLDEIDRKPDQATSKDAQKWEKFLWLVFSAVVGAVLALVFRQIGLSV